VVGYVWENGEGSLTDKDNDGIYEAVIEKVPEGTYSLVITVLYGDDIYNFESYEMIIITDSSAVGGVLLFIILLTVFITTAIALGSYLYVYHKVLRFPKPVRKVRKYTRSLRKTKAPQVSILARKKAFDSTYKEELNKSSRFLKGKPIKIKKPITGKISIKDKSEGIPEDSVSEVKNDSTNINSKPQDKNKNSKQFLNSQKIHSNKVRGRLRKIWYRATNFNKNNKSWKLAIIFMVLILNLLIFSQFINYKLSVPSQKEGSLGISGQQSYTVEWLDNPTFDDPIEPTWFSLYGEYGDNSDVIATTSSGQANFEVLGGKGTFSDILGVPKASDGWIEFNHAVRPPPNIDHSITTYGLNASHVYDEGTGYLADPDQSSTLAGILWKRNISMSVDMSDYIITSASVSATVNGSADTNIETPPDRDYLYNSAGGYASLYDYARFYVEISDLQNIESYEVAYNKTLNLGRGNQSRTDF
ncbi:hypothetical protein LCGC14_2578650, partial [marine sediment metagenome]